LWVLRDGAPAVVAVELGITDGEQTEVVSGLSAGDQVIVGSNGQGGAGSRDNGGRRRFRPPRVL
jgi:hypothetical protein